MLGEYYLNKLIKNPSFAIKINKSILDYSDQLVAFSSKKVYRKNLKSLSNIALLDLYKEYERWHGELYVRAILPVYLELYKPHLTTFLVEYLRRQTKEYNISKTPKECFALLTVPDKFSKIQQEEKLFLKIAGAIQKNSKARQLFRSKKNLNLENIKKITPALRKIIEKHIKDFSYLGYNFEGPAFPDAYFLSRWKEMIKNNEDPAKLLKNIDLERQSSARERKDITKILNIDQRHQEYFQITREIIYGKDYRKMALVKSYYELEPLIKELARRTCLTINEVRNCLIPELKSMLLGKIDRPPDLTKRMKGCLFIVIKRELPGRVFVDEMFTKMNKYLKSKQKFDEINYFHGQTAATGRAKGIVKIINNTKDLPKMKPGNVLVSQMTNPDLVPAMKKASAIITDLGGITCHAAIVARELKIPCVIGTKVATQALKDGDEVIVDADQGEVRKIG